MRIWKRLATVVAVLAVLSGALPELSARSRKSDRLLAQGRVAEQRKEWDKALALYEQAQAQDPGDTAIRLAALRVRFQAGQAHVEQGLKLRAQGKLDEALAELQKAYAIDPSSTIAEQELRVTREMIDREKKKTAAGQESNPEERGMTPAAQERQEILERIGNLRNVPELKPLSAQPINLRINNQTPKVLFETVAKLAGINLILDPDYRSEPSTARNLSLELSNATVEQALDYLAALTKSYWKPLSANTIFVTNDNQVKRRDYEDMVLKVFYLTNLTTPQELTEISTMLRSITDIRRVHQYTAQNMLIVRGTPDQVLLAEKLINDLDKPKAEVVVDVLVMEANRAKTRDLAATIASGGSSGVNTNITFSPRNPVLLGGQTSSSSTTSTTNTTGTTTTTPAYQNPYNPYQSPYGYGGYGGVGTFGGTSTSAQAQLISLARIAHVSTNDFSITLPGALLQAVMTDRNTKVLQSPQVRAAHGQKASLRIGDKVPIASGGMQPFGGVVGGFSSLYSQFQFLDVGVNVDITPTVHGNNEVTLKVVLEISTVRDRIDLGGISQPVIGQRKVEHEIRIHEGEVSLLGGLMQTQETRSLAGIPGLMNIPVLKRIFSSENVEKNESELLIALVPHIVRTPGVTDLNLKPVAAGTDAAVKVSRAPREPEPPAPPKEVKPAAPPAPQPAAAAPAPVQTASPAPPPAAVPVQPPALAAPKSQEAKPPAAVPVQPPALPAPKPQEPKPQAAPAPQTPAGPPVPLLPPPAPAPRPGDGPK